MLPVSDLTH